MSKKYVRQFRVIIVNIMIFTVSFFGTGLAYASEITADKIVELTNQSRAEAGLGKLTVNAKLTLAAKKKADDMFGHQYFEHVSPVGVTPWHWFEAVGYDYIFAAENLAIDFTTAEGAHSAFMKSTGHRENILGASYKEIGVAAISGLFENKESIIIVEEFGALRDQKIEVFFEAAEQTEKIENLQTAKAEEPFVEKVNAPVVEKVNVPVVWPVEEIEVDIIPEPEPPVTIESSQQETVPPVDIAMGEPEYGKIMSEIYSIKNVGTLKDVYAENIYWKQSDEGVSLLAYSKAKLKFILKDILGAF